MKISDDRGKISDPAGKRISRKFRILPADIFFPGQESALASTPSDRPIVCWWREAHERDDRED
jgi:hypothetical protein